jgi:hypothetical protein
MSPVGCLSWGIVAAAWGIALLSQAVKYTPVTTRTGWLLGGAMALLFATAIGDSVYYRRR